MDANLTFLLICMLVMAAACLAIWLLKNKPVRIAAVIMALAGLVGALTPLISPLKEEPQPVVAPAPATSASVFSDTPMAAASPTAMPFTPLTATPSVGSE